MNILETLNKYEPRSSHHEVSVIWERARDCYVWDNEGQRYIDFTSGIFVANVGHSHPEVIRAIVNQANNHLIHSYAFPTEVRAKLVEKLCQMTGFEKIFLCSTGSEAIEAALRCMSVAGTRGQYDGIFGAFHGNTLGSKFIWKHLTYECHPPLITRGLVFESYLGWNAQFHPIEWVQEWCKWANDNDVPVCFDEIQSGMGRTGKLFAYEHYGVTPDLVCIGKGLGGGVPISAVLGSTKLLDQPDDLSSTHTGNPVCCAAALITLEVLEREHLIDRAFQLGCYLETRLPELFPDYIVMGKGLIWAIHMNDIALANRVVDKAAELGLLLVKTNKGTIKIGPPLTITMDLLDEGLLILRKAVEKCTSVTSAL